MLSVKNLMKKYNEETVVHNISFSVNPGEIVGLLGPNGAGKTTSLNMITGIVKSNDGLIEFDGKNIEDTMVYYKKNMGFVSDVFPLYENLTGREFVVFVAELWGVSKDYYEQQIDDLAQNFYLDDKLDDFIKTYSKGMRQKISLIGALIHKPKLLILDEPFNGLDPVSIREIKKFFLNYIKKGNSIIFSSHILDIVEKICTRCVIINNGKIVADGTIDSFVHLLQKKELESDLETLFFELTKHD
ncbi:ABC transporter ATP-binding protein [Bacillus toyonensis]|uniref:ABC transporter domain-containing protein n=1 Tax=Bacillus toyonensis TaxID=155322 RepID=A0AAP8JX01_9BACI|nr:ABC transporter ATP-binding protein [Bacillus toyonensis]PEB89944.1 hypothetical protein CON81_27925 [Bacillus toyonensis]PHE11410.1 hypothetical protein COF62_16310 [Bacillus toyonensis]